MSVKQEIESKLKKEVEGVSKKLQMPIDKLAPADQVEEVIFHHAQTLVDRIKINLASVVQSPSMINSIKAFKGKANYSVTVGPDYDYYNAFVLHFIEIGTAERFRRHSKKGRGGKTVSSGIIPARPFMRPAYESMKAELFSKIQKSIIQMIEAKLR